MFYIVFFELFDLKNIPKAELIMYSCKKGESQDNTTLQAFS